MNNMTPALASIGKQAQSQQLAILLWSVLSCAQAHLSLAARGLGICRGIDVKAAAGVGTVLRCDMDGLCYHRESVRPRQALCQAQTNRILEVPKRRAPHRQLYTRARAHTRTHTHTHPRAHAHTRTHTHMHASYPRRTRAKSTTSTAARPSSAALSSGNDIFCLTRIPRRHCRKVWSSPHLLLIPPRHRSRED